MSNRLRPVPGVRIPLIVITGPTGSGKTALAVELADRYGGEIICADSRTVYRGLDIGTAKPGKQEQARVKHHLLDVVEPNQRFTLKDFQSLAYRAIEDIEERRKIPFLVGGSGLYIDCVVLEYQLNDGEADLAKRNELEKLDVSRLQELLGEEGIDQPSNPLNKRQLIRAYERQGINNQRLATPDKNTIVVQISTEKVELERRLIERAEQIFASGVVAEAEAAAAKYGWDNPAMSGNIYPIIHDLVDGKIDLPEAKRQFVRSDMRLVKKQLTWTRRHKFVHRLSLREAEDFLAKEIEHRLSA
ncbi:MAG TPA: tRNA (adenosine(37)-N6)-dimethylallyltransferase MiaA [Candidatus Saccharimonadales bacterium]|nr:tRNA (adenosine(37)-N6)-dimethylallyltransferase MiaA [Candidatus Saccharimonadales bacterium]